MGTWGAGAFENDAGMDLLADLERSGVQCVRDALDRAANTPANEYLDADDGASAVAAAELLAAAFGLVGAPLPPRASSWLRHLADSCSHDDLEIARRAVDRVVAAESELAELWRAREPENAWRVHVQVLAGRLPESTGVRSQLPVAVEDPFLHLKQALRTFLHMRGLALNASQAARISASRDGAEISRWLSRAVSATAAADLFDAPH